MTTSSDDRDAPGPKAAPDSTDRPIAKPAAKPAAIGRPGQAALLAGFAALASANAAAAAPSATAPGVTPDRAYLEALLYGSWTQPPDLNVRRLPHAQLDPAAEQFKVADAFSDQGGTGPYHDSIYVDSGFGDRTDR